MSKKMECSTEVVQVTVNDEVAGSIPASPANSPNPGWKPGLDEEPKPPNNIIYLSPYDHNKLKVDDTLNFTDEKGIDHDCIPKRSEYATPGLGFVFLDGFFSGSFKLRYPKRD